MALFKTLLKRRASPVPRLEREHLTLTARGLEINREWSVEDFRALQARIEEREGRVREDGKSC